MYAVLTSTKYNGNPLMDWGVWNFPHHKYMLGVYTHIIVIVVGYLSSFLFKSDLAPDNLTIYGWWDELKVNRSNKRNGIVK
jgi:SSS family solute:Na+ symporter